VIACIEAKPDILTKVFFKSNVARVNKCSSSSLLVHVVYRQWFLRQQIPGTLVHIQ